MISRTIIGNEIARQIGVPQYRGQRAVGIFIQMIAAELASGQDAALMGFGTFAVRHLPAREGRNPRTGEKIAIAASVGVTFRPAKALKDALKAALNPQQPKRQVGGERNSPMPQRKRA